MKRERLSFSSYLMTVMVSLSNKKSTRVGREIIRETDMDVHELLLKVQNKELDLATAEAYLKKLPYEDLGFAKLDHHRALRSGFGEVVYCAGKTTEHLVKIFESFSARRSNVLGTRASGERMRPSGPSCRKRFMRNCPGQFICSIMCRSSKGGLPCAPAEPRISRWLRRLPGQQNFSGVM